MAWNRKEIRPGQVVRERVLSAKKPYVSYTRRVTRVKTDQRLVTIAFDDGPVDLPASPDKFSGRALTDILLDTLREYGALGTFCMVGDTGENYPDAVGRAGRPRWNGLRFDHYPDINQDERGGVVNNPEIVGRILAEGHQAVNHSYRHIPFGRLPFPYGKRACLGNLEQVMADLARLHGLLEEKHGYTMTMGRPPWYMDRISGGYTSLDAFDQMGYLYLAGSFRGESSQPLESLQAEADAMVMPMGKVLAANPDALCGQIICQRDGYNTVRRTPVVFGLRKQLDLLQRYGYRVVTAQQLVERSPFADVGPGEPGFDKLVWLQKTRAIAYWDNCLRLDAPMTWGELAMLLAPRKEAVHRRIQQIRETGKSQHPHWGAMDWCAEQGILKYAMDPDGPVKSLPMEFFDPIQGYTRRQVYEAFRD